MTTDRPTNKDVFIQAVRDHLDNNAHANHPVQFKPTIHTDTSVCLLCCCLVLFDYQDEHRRYHDLHNSVHDQIMRQANRHIPEPRYGGR